MVEQESSGLNSFQCRACAADIRLVEESTLPVRRTLKKIGIPHATFYGWYDPSAANIRSQRVRMTNDWPMIFANRTRTFAHKRPRM
jgi:hypothetical protein